MPQPELTQTRWQGLPAEIKTWWLNQTPEDRLFNGLSLGSAVAMPVRGLAAAMQTGKTIMPALVNSGKQFAKGLAAEGIENILQGIVDSRAADYGLAAQDAARILKAIR